MQQTLSEFKPVHGQQDYGGRISSPKLRASLELSNDFLGLEEDTKRYDLLLLVKRTGKLAGFTPRMISLLDYYMSFTRDIDWEEGHSPIVYQSLSRTALDLGVSERQIQKLENALFEVGAITWNDSGNHRRFGQRCEETGAILYAYGVDLTPLAYLRPELKRKLEEKKAHDRQWMEAKRQISWYRRQIRAMIAELVNEKEPCDKFDHFEASYNAIAVQIRTHMDLSRLDALKATHKSLYEEVCSHLESISKTEKCSPKSAEEFTHYKSTTQQSSIKIDTSKASPNGFQERRNETVRTQSEMPAKLETSKKEEERALTNSDLILGTGLQHITLKQVLNAASENFRAHLPLMPRPMKWQDVVEAAYAIRPSLGISQQSWVNACMVLGRTGAAICLLLTESGTRRDKDPVLKPAGYFNAMIKRAYQGELNLHKSIFGILKREGETE